MDPCEEVFLQKMSTYGLSWRIMRMSSLTDQLMIKARRIRQVERAQAQAVSDSIEEEWIGIVNYALMALIQLNLGVLDNLDGPGVNSAKGVAEAYKKEKEEVFTLLGAKNTDYDNAWKDMLPSSITDQVLMKLWRLREIHKKEDGPSSKPLNGRADLVKSIYQDIVNYALFSLWHYAPSFRADAKS